MKAHKGRITISRYTSNVEGRERGVRIQLEDETSGCRVADIELTIEAMAEALFGLCHQECEFETFPECPIGKKRELREITIPRPPHKADSQTWILRHAKKELVDGWHAHSPSEIHNPHRWAGDKQVRLTLIRFV